jgi:UDP-glucose 4-epimerase
MPTCFTGKRSLVTGATGFIGRHLVAALLERGYKVKALVRNKDKAGTLWPDNSVTVSQGDLTQSATLENSCVGIDSVFHLASCNCAEDSDGGEAEKLHQAVTVQGTRCLLRAAARAEVKSFIFISSVKAMGEGHRDCLDEMSPPTPETAYGRAKLAAEQIVLEAGRKYGMHVCNLRLPVVYGLGNAGNLPRMIAAIEGGWFPALPAVGNRRSMVHVNDVIQATLLAAENVQAKNQTYIVTDGRVYSTSQIYDLIQQTLGRRIPRWRVPALLLQMGAKVGDAAEWLWGNPGFFNSESLHKLIGSAWYSCDKIQQELGYTPQYSLEGALPEIVRKQIP